MADGVQGRSDAWTYTVATWIYLLHTSGLPISNGDVGLLLGAIDDSETEEVGEAAGLALVAYVLAAIDQPSVEAIVRFASGLVGAHVVSNLGAGERAERTARIRAYQFAESLPWLAQVWSRTPDAQVVPTWVLVERLTDQVQVMDPNPWDDVDEERRMPVTDFHVLWELSGCASVAVRAAGA